MGRWRALGKKAGLASFVLLSSFHATTWTQQAIDERRARNDPVRVQFQQEFGFPLQGAREEIDVPKRIADFANALHYTNAENISVLKVLPQEYTRRPWYRQAEEMNGRIASLFGKKSVRFDNSGRYIENIPLLPRHQMELEGQNPGSVIIHEIAHAKINAATHRVPSFAEEWLKASGVKKEVYHPFAVQALIYLNFIDVPSDLEERESYNKLGFSSKSSVTHWKEDAADLVADGERAMLLFHDQNNDYSTRYLDWLSNSPAVRNQVKVLEKYGVVPPEFTEGLRLQREYRAMHEVPTVSQAKTFLRKSEEFLQKHPGTKYEIQVRYARARAYWHLAKLSPTPWPNQEAAIDELITGLQGAHKELRNYRNSLQLLKTYAFTIGDKKLESVCAGAIEEHTRRHEANDVTLSRTGVQDYLASHDARFQ